MFSLRFMRRNFVSTATAILVIGLAIATFTLVSTWTHGILLEPLPFPEPSELHSVRQVIPPQGDFPERVRLVPEDFFWQWKETTQALEGLAAYSEDEVGLGFDAGPRAVRAAFVSPGFFRVLRYEPNLGRAFQEEDERADAPVVVLDHALWIELFGGSSEVLGDTVRVNGRELTVIGVMPEEFAFPSTEVRLWLPLVRSSNTDEGAVFVRRLHAVARIASGSTAEDAAREGEEVQRALAGGESSPEPRIVLRNLREEIVGDVRPGLVALLAAALVLAMVAAANVAGIIISRHSARRREFATRAALGAGRSSMIRLVVGESMLLALAGSFLGIALTWSTHRLWIRLLPPDLPRLEAIEIKLGILALGAVLAITFTALFGLWPALRTRPSFEALREGVASGRRGRALGRWLVTVETALATSVMVLALLLTISFERLSSVESGFREEGVLTARLDLGHTAGARPSRAIFDQLLQRLEADPRIESAGVVSHLPLASGYSITLGRRVDRPDVVFRVSRQWTSPGYRDAQGLQLESGRWITEQEHDSQLSVGVVNEALVEAAFGSDDPLGRRVEVGGAELEIVGVVEDTRFSNLASEAQPAFYLSYRLAPGSGPSSLALAVHAEETRTVDLVETIRASITEIAPDLPLSDIATMESRLSGSLARERFFAFLSMAFALLAASLSAAAIFGLVNQGVNQERREIGVRRALGARMPDVVRQVLGRVLFQVALGITAGLLFASYAGGAVSSLLFGIEVGDALPYLLAAAFFTSIALAASWFPVSKAVRVDPAEVLRYE